MSHMTTPDELVERVARRKPEEREIMTASQLREMLCYDCDTGLFTWRINRSSNAMEGFVAGSVDAKGYVLIWINGRRHMAHRLAWLYVYGSWPNKQIDHINRHKNDNRIINLRLANNAQNQQNIEPTAANTSGVIGVCWNQKLKKWQAQIGVNGRTKYLGVYADFNSAVNARKNAEHTLHPFRSSMIGKEP